MAIECKDIKFILDVGERGFLVKTNGGIELNLNRQEGKELAERCEREKQKSKGFEGQLAPGEKASYFQDGDEPEQHKGKLYVPKRR